MSFNVLVITEDHTKDQYIVKPLVEKILQDLGKTRAKVRVCVDPRFQGFSDCTDVEKLRTKVIEAYPMVHLFLLLVDRDCEVNRHLKLASIESAIASSLREEQLFITCQALQEVEVWTLAGQTLPPEWRWAQIRSERDPKESYYIPLAKQKGFYDYPANGRKEMMLESLKNWNRVKQLCPEDIVALMTRLQNP